MEPTRRAVWIECDACNGTGKQAREWDVRTGAVMARGTCTSCLGQCKLLANAPPVAMLAGVS